ncbi:MAG: SpoIIE family protein phosphatase [Treponema sp.]|nr:SpoIIE family protein phosphatase [Treponema sp.]
MICIKKYISLIFIIFISTLVFATDFYWDDPFVLTDTDSRFPQSLSNGKDLSKPSVIYWEEVDSKKSVIYISSMKTYDGENWEKVERFAGPYEYSGEVPDQYSVAMNDDGVIAVAVLTTSNTLSVFTSYDKGDSYSEYDFPFIEDAPLLAPRIYANASGGFTLFATQGFENTFSLMYATSKDGKSWSEFSHFLKEGSFYNPFIPVLIPVKNENKNVDLVIFQAQYNNGSRLVYQLYKTLGYKGEKEGQLEWSEPVLISNENSFQSFSSKFELYHNQRPSLFRNIDNKLYIAWERTYYTSENAHVWVAELNEDGSFVQNTAFELNTSGSAHRPAFFVYKKDLYLIWFDNRHGNDVVNLVKKGEYSWESSDEISSYKRSSAFAYPVVCRGEQGLSFIWQETGKKESSSRIYQLKSDHTVAPPSLTAKSFKEGKKSTASKVRVRVKLPEDSSGIEGYSWIWTQDEEAEPEKVLSKKASDLNLTGDATEDGYWYFKVRCLDFAGNWSESASIAYCRDTTPPEMPIILPMKTDSLGFMKSNTFSVQWKKADEEDDDIAGYSWNLEYISSLPSQLISTDYNPLNLNSSKNKNAVEALLKRCDAKIKKNNKAPKRIRGKNTSFLYKDKRNGVYVFSVSAIDSVGNVSNSAYSVVILNKYKAVTSIISIDTKKDVFNDVSISIAGTDFLFDGTIEEIYFDRDGKAPYDMTFTDGFKVVSNNEITGIHTRDLEEGVYKIGLKHTNRGVYFSKPLLRIERNGTVKFESEYEYKVQWNAYVPKKYIIDAGIIFLASVFILSIFGFIFALLEIKNIAGELLIVRSDIKAVLEGRAMKVKADKKINLFANKKISLKIKLSLFTAILVIMVVSLVSVPLGFMMVRNQEKTLSSGLKNRVNVLLESLSSGVKAYMPSANVLELSNLPNQTNALTEARYATITGLEINGENVNLDYVWASNDKDIENKIDGELTYGSSRLLDETFADIAKKCGELNEIAANEVSDIATNIAELTEEGLELISKNDEESIKRRDEIGSVTMLLNNRLSSVLSDIASKASSAYPPYDENHISSDTNEYIFYKPVLYRQGTSDTFVHGIIYIAVSTDKLIAEIRSAKNTIFFTSTLIAIIAVTLGTIGAIIVSSIIIKPIKKLESYVSMISDTQDKMKLAGKNISIGGNDEISSLGEKINEMTKSLVKAAEDEKLLMDGKVVQQAFLPLSPSSKGGKLTIAELKEGPVQCFGYYEGASGVSGDYFDYKKLDNRWFAIIKCDVSGHGVPAALIMTVVATLFRKYFESWTFEKNGTKLDSLIMQINDFIEPLGLKGKFATIILCLCDTKTGNVYLCNAGDNIVHIYDNSLGYEKVVTLPETPAAGPLPSFMVEMKGGFSVEKQLLKKGDVLFLYTDGIEESTRKFRDEEFHVKKCDFSDNPGDVHENHKVGSESEQMEPDRVKAIIEAVFAKRVYVLEKYHNPVINEHLEFDFTSCDGSIEEAVIALAAVEKVFRMYKPSDVTELDTVQIDKRIDAFLKKHFNLYNYYCENKNEISEDSNYLEYTFLREDEQLDDLTLLAIRRAD